MSTDGWRKDFADVVAAIKATLADASNAGSMTAAAFTKLAGLPSSAVPTTRNVGTTAPLAGGGDLSADRTLSIVPASAIVPGSMSSADFTKLAGLPSSAVPTTRNVGTTAPLTGGGDLSADRTLAISAASAGAAGSLAAADFSIIHSLTSGFGARPLLGVFSTPEMDFLAAPGTTYAFDMPTAPFGFGYLPCATSRAWVSDRNGTITTGPVVKIGNNGSHDNLYTGLAAVPITTTVKNSSVSHLAASTQATPDGSAGPYVVEITSSAVAGTATVFKGRFLFLMALVTLTP